MEVKSRLESIKQTDFTVLIFHGAVHSRALFSEHTMQSVDINQPKSAHFFSAHCLLADAAIGPKPETSLF
jgi:hypothetical protein